ncbi:hypothetical protein DKX38_003970 [Salix brachista]|uniref:Profilin n=1 Tax=Salix brachista TaxID=2182728 RepID=A0A5N5NC19_9ROSI|nr:hypothetical protein DKX38_003970 [Salix brachista]
MAYRGRGRGRGRFGGGGGFSYARQEPFDLFPEIELPDPKNVKEERALVVWNSRLTNYFKSSPCYLEEIVSKEIQSMDIERFSDRGKRRITSEHDSLDQFLQLTSKNFPKELIGGLPSEITRYESNACLNRKRPNKKVKWTADLRKLDDYEKRELIYENIDFDDDEDDYNMEDDNAGMPLFSNLNSVSPASVDDAAEIDVISRYGKRPMSCRIWFMMILFICFDCAILLNFVPLFLLLLNAPFLLDMFKPEEISSIMKDFDEPGSLAPTGLYLGGTKYMVIQGEAGAVIRGKKGSGGITVKKTAQALIFGIYDEPLTPGQCNMIVERLGDYLLDQGL